MQKAASLAALAGLAAWFLLAGAAADEKEKPKASAKAPGLEMIKRLAGDWEATEVGSKDGHKGRVNYRVTSGDSAVIETLFAGTDHEMVTVYHQDGPDLVLTHYCMLHNQPRMRAERGTPANQIAFKFTGGSNIKPDKDMHMHDLKLTFVDSNHVKAEWTLYQGGKAEDTKVIELTRKKKE
jgi:hypothetical protein